MKYLINNLGENNFGKNNLCFTNFQLGKQTRRDKVVVYWASYLDKRQRVLLLTQDERIARRARRAIDAERSHLELFLSINGFGMSLVRVTTNNRSFHHVRHYTELIFRSATMIMANQGS